MKTCAGIVLYNPDNNRLKANLDAVCPQVDKVVCIDNGSEDLRETEVLLGQYSKVALIRNNANLGIAAALNQIFRYSIDEGCDWVLTLDQDSVCEEGLVEEYCRYTDDRSIGMMTCIIVDRNMDTDEFGDRNQRELTDVEQCITSGAFCSADAYRQTPGFDDKLFIDWVDYDYSAALRSAGYRICRVPFIGLIHELGRGDVRRLLGENRVVLNESPFRVYHRFRNKLLVCSRYPEQYGKKRAVKSTVKDLLIILLFEKDKRSKIKAAARGIIDAGMMIRDR